MTLTHLTYLTTDHLKEKEFLFDFIRSGLDWFVKNGEIPAITNRKEFIEAHIRNTKSHLPLTNRVLQYPDRLIFALTIINDEFCLRKLINFLATTGKILLGPYNPHIENQSIEAILNYLFKNYYKHQFRTQGINEHIISDYVTMLQAGAQWPNLRIKSFQRLKAEHDQLVKELQEDDVPEFEVKDIQILPIEKDGYFFSCICNRQLLIAEADEMQHCVASYAHEIISGYSVLYSIRGKERATVEFRDFGTGYYCLAQVYSYYNRDVSKELFELLCVLVFDSKKGRPENVHVDQHPTALHD
jgi:hypothetical protein